MQIDEKEYLNLIKTQMLYRMTKNALRNNVPYEYILIMLGELPTKPAEPVKTSDLTVEAPAPKATVKRRIEGKSISEEQVEKIKQLVKEGKTVKEIVELTGVSDPTVRKYKAEVVRVNDEE